MMKIVYAIFLTLLAVIYSVRGYAQDITQAEYEEGLEWREDSVDDSLKELRSTRSSLDEVERDLRAKEADLIEAEAVFRAAEKSGDSDELSDAWEAIRIILSELDLLSTDYNTAVEEFTEHQSKWQKDSIWLEQFKNDYVAQSESFTIRDAIARCARMRCSPSSFLNDERFTVFQPHVLEMVGVHYAYAQGLTGKGVRIAIEDDIVNFTLPEFADRVSFDGTTLTYPVPYGDDFTSDAKRCERGQLSSSECQYWLINDFEEVENLSVRWVVAQYGWPEERENWFFRNEDYPEGHFLRWSRIPNGTSSGHGTIVASVAAGRDFGVAPGSTIIPVAQDFSNAQFDQQRAERSLLNLIRTLPELERTEFDSEFATSVRSDYSKYDIINRSFGIGVFDPASISYILDDKTKWWGEGFRKLLPETWRAFMQTGTHPDERTIVVYASGNDFEEHSGLGADLPYYESHVRGHQLSVMAVDHTGTHADYTNFCGPLPIDWDVGRWGRHFCLAAPGMVNSAGAGGKGWIYHQVEGTSFAAPVVTGAIALLMEKFRGQLGNTEIVKRLVNTANNTGRYAQLEIYGAGLLDLEAALKPVGETVTGTSAVTSQTASTMFIVPPAFGDVGQRLANMGVEVATLDSLGAPFWTSPEQYMQTLWDPWGAISSFSAFQDSRLGLVPQQAQYSFQGNLSAAASLPVFASGGNASSRNAYFGFTPGTYAGPVSINGVQMLVGRNKIGFEKAPLSGFRWGFLGDSSSWQGGRSSGAFGDQAGSVTAWLGRSERFELGNSWSLNASASLVIGKPVLESGGMLDVYAHLLSTWDVSLEREFANDNVWSGFSLSQPLRAEAGKGTFSFLSGLENGKPAYDQQTFSLTPASRELELAWTLEAPVAWGRGAFEIAHSLNAGHVTGRERSRIGLAWWWTW